MGRFKANPIIWTLAVNYVTMGVIRLVWVNKQIYPDMVGTQQHAVALFDGIYRLRFFNLIGLPLVILLVLVVVGGGDSACEEALYLTRFGSIIHLIHRRDTLRASRIMSDRVLAHPKIKPIWDSVITEVLDVKQDKVTGVRVKHLKTGAEGVLECAGVFVAIGHVPNTAMFAGKLDMDEKGYIKTTPGTTMTSVEGVFAAGDVQDSKYRQAVTAVGSGCMAYIEAGKYLNAMGDK